jgi:uncharacterized protein (DUF305 family)
MMKKLWLTVLVLVLLVGVSAAAADSHSRAERAEIRFLQGMTDHHQMALDMANDCLGKAQTESLLALCQAVIDAQTPEIEQMTAWLLEWYNIAYTPISMTDMIRSDSPMTGMNHGEHNMGDMAAPFTDPPMMMGMMAGFNRLEGVAYEIAWLESMIDHHDDALHMSERILPRVVHPEVGELAGAIIEAQTAEIALMETMIADLESQR